MDLRHYPVPGTPYMKTVDLEDRSPLTETEAYVLNAAVSRLIKERAELSEHIQKVSQRLVLSAEAKVAAGRREQHREAK